MSECPECGAELTEGHVPHGYDCMLAKEFIEGAKAGGDMVRDQIVKWLRSVAEPGRDGYLIGSPRTGYNGTCEHSKYRWEDCADCEALNIADDIEAGAYWDGEGASSGK